MFQGSESGRHIQINELIKQFHADDLIRIRLNKTFRIWLVNQTHLFWLVNQTHSFWLVNQTYSFWLVNQT